MSRSKSYYILTYTSSSVYFQINGKKVKVVLAVVVQRRAAYCNGFPCEGDALTRAAGARERSTALPGV